MYSQNLINKIERLRLAKERQRLMEKWVSCKEIENMGIFQKERKKREYNRRDPELRGLRPSRIWIDEATEDPFTKIFLKYKKEWEQKQLTTST